MGTNQLVLNKRRKMGEFVEKKIISRELGRVMILKKISCFLLVLAIIFFIILPVFAEEDYRQLNVEFSFAPTNFSGGNVAGYGGSLNELRLRVDKRFYQGVWAGACFTYGNGTLGGRYTNAVLNDWEFYLKVPFNYQAEVEAERKNLPSPPESPLYFSFGYKSALLTSNDLQGNLTWEDGHGPGLGVGLDYPLESVYVYGYVALYPRMLVRSASTANANAFYKDWVYEAGVKVPLKWGDNVFAGIGYRGETHIYSNVNLVRGGLEGTLTWKF